MKDAMKDATKDDGYPSRKGGEYNKKPAIWRARIQECTPEHLAPFFHEGGTQAQGLGG
jgi:hypothetical protein